MATNSNFVGRFSEKNLHSKIKGPLPLLSTQIRDFCYFLSLKIREFGGITVYWKKKKHIKLAI